MTDAVIKALKKAIPVTDKTKGILVSIGTDQYNDEQTLLTLREFSNAIGKIPILMLPDMGFEVSETELLEYVTAAKRSNLEFKKCLNCNEGILMHKDAPAYEKKCERCKKATKEIHGKAAPYTDCKGNKLYEGDRIKWPNSDVIGTVFCEHPQRGERDQWRVKCEGEEHSVSLRVQVNHSGQAYKYTGE